MDVSDSQASCTLYVQEVYQKLSPREAKRGLFMLFNRYGSVVDVQLSRKNSMRGQAFVVFENPSDCEFALKSIQGAKFFGKTLRIFKARSEGLALAIHRGQFIKRNLASSSKSLIKLSGFPLETKPELLEFILKNVEGFVGMRLIEQGLALIAEYEHEASAKEAVRLYDGYRLTEEAILKAVLFSGKSAEN